MTATLRPPTVADAAGIHRLVEATGVLDVNSGYAYLAVCAHHAATSVVAEADGRLAGFVTGYRIPDRPDTLFVWQVGVDAAARGQGLATRMLEWLLEATGAAWVETTITPSNEPSRRLFRRLAERRGAGCEVSEGFPVHLFPGPAHEPEELFRLGPFRSEA